MIEITLEEGARAIEAEAGNSQGWASLCGRPFPPVSIDSRTLSRGEAFFAIQGPNHDGHCFIEDALRAGAALVVHSRPYRSPGIRPDSPFLRVPNTTVALQTLAHYVRSRWHGLLIGITGSVGKTTTREFTGTILQEKFQVLQSPGNFNNEFGVPLSLLRITDSDDTAVLELGMNHAGEIGFLSRLCQPTMALVTNVQPVHLQFFRDLDAIAEAKGEILEHLPEDGVLVFNADDPRVVRLASRFPGRTISFGLEKESDCRITGYRFLGLQRMEFSMLLQGKRFEACADFSGKHFLYNLAAAAAAALGSGLSGEQIRAGLSRLKAARMRGQVLQFGQGPGKTVTVLDDSYNSNPAALSSLFETLKELTGFQRKILALGEMLELGERSGELHREAGRELVSSGADLLVTVGCDAKHFRVGALQAGFCTEAMYHFDNSETAAEYLVRMLQPGDLLVCKGSRRTRMDRIVTRIKSSWGGQA